MQRTLLPLAIFGTTVFFFLSPSTTNAPVQPQPPPAQIDSCSKFSAADAQAITGVPMKVSPKASSDGFFETFCSYDEASPTPGVEAGRVSFKLVLHKSPEDAGRQLNSFKFMLHLTPENSEPLNGIGDETWFHRVPKEGKLRHGVLLARKGNSFFILMMDRASPEAVKNIAGKIASGLP